MKRIVALFTAMLIVLGAGTAYAGDTVLYTPMLSAPVGGHLACHVTNVGKKTLSRVQITLKSTLSSGMTTCDGLNPVSTSDIHHTCYRTATDSVLCQVAIAGGNHRSVRAVLNVVDSNGATILSVPATK